MLVVATNCNGGVKEVLSFGTPPREDALWHHRCPTSPEFSGELPPLLGQARTVHWFDPCALLTDDARSEYRPAPDPANGIRAASSAGHPHQPPGCVGPASCAGAAQAANAEQEPRKH